MTIDVHTHYHSHALAGKAGPLGPTFNTRANGTHYWQIGQRQQAAPESIYDLNTRLRQMDDAGIAMHVLGSSPKWYLYNFIHPIDPATCIAFSRVQNDDLIKAAKAHPTRFQALATLPLVDLQESVRELERVANEGACGIIIDSTVNGKGLDDEQLFPLYERLEKYNLPMFVHPTFLPDPRVERNGLRWLIGFCFDETYAVTCLILGGVFDRYPKLKVAISHGGGAFPFLQGRLVEGVAHRGDVVVKNKQPLATYLKNIYFDACVYDATSLCFLLERVGEDNVVFGTNYPGNSDMRPSLIESLGLDPAVQRKLTQGNAERLFGWR